MGTCERPRSSRSVRTRVDAVMTAVVRLATAALLGAFAAAPLHAQGAAPAAGNGNAAPKAKWVLPRTPDGHPDLQGNWSNATMTPLERPAGQGRALTPEQVAALEKVRSDSLEKGARASDPNRPAPPVGGDGSTGAAGMVGGYNLFYIDAGDHFATVNGEVRSSFIIDPPNGRLPALLPQAKARLAARAAYMRGKSEYDHPEFRPLAERCIMSFGSNAGPPMLPNGFYNNNYTIVQRKDVVLIMTEMVHDVRIIRMNATPSLPPTMRPWMGESVGKWVGDTLVVTTTNLPSRQFPFWQFSGAIVSDSFTVTEKFHRTGQYKILYRFTVQDPGTWATPWSGELPFNKMDDLIYEYACHEGNYALSNVLSGARAMEREAAAKAKP